MPENIFGRGLLADILADPRTPRRSGLLGDLLAASPPSMSAPRDLPNLFSGIMTDVPQPPQIGLLGLGQMTGRAQAWGALTGTPVDRRDPTGIDAIARALNALSPTPAPTVPVVNRFIRPIPVQPVPRSAPRRHAFFSFHYQEDITRVNQVRNSWRIRAEDHVPGFFDRSLWERVKRTDASSLKRMIQRGLKGTSVTCVLVGEQTWARPWVRYELAESVSQGNGLLAIDIHELFCIKAKRCGARGRNPLDFMGVYRADDGEVYICELWDGAWRRYPHLTDSVAWPAYLRETGALNEAHPLSAGIERYAYKSAGGYHNLSSWISEAARAARRG